MNDQQMASNWAGLNWRRGLRRFWLLATMGLWIGMAAFQLPDLLTAPRVVIETDQVQKLRKLLEQYRQNALPDAVRDEVRSKLERGELTAGVRYTVTVTVAGVEQRTAYPAEMEEAQVRTAANQWMASLTRQAWIKLAGMAFGLPLALILLTRAVAWGIRGFGQEGLGQGSLDNSAASMASGASNFAIRAPQRTSPPAARPTTATAGRQTATAPTTAPIIAEASVSAPISAPTSVAVGAASQPSPDPNHPQQYRLITDTLPLTNPEALPTPTAAGATNPTEGDDSGHREPTFARTNRRQPPIKLEI
ncbi:MAG: hypothetical protein FJX22_04690 [Alphaproteobacteria bacterium]|nr:hypothetical protein [Alphaproteobacteria bacterium]